MLNLLINLIIFVVQFRINVSERMLQEIRGILFISVMSFLIVLMAMSIDLVSGLYKAHIRREAKRSQLLKRTVNKFILYQGSLIIATGIDILIAFAHTFQLVGVSLLVGVPIVTILIAIFLCTVEIMSVKEKADEKLHTEMANVEKLAEGILSDKVLRAFEDAIIERIRHEKEN